MKTMLPIKMPENEYSYPKPNAFDQKEEEKVEPVVEEEKAAEGAGGEDAAGGADEEGGAGGGGGEDEDGVKEMDPEEKKGLTLVPDVKNYLHDEYGDDTFVRDLNKKQEQKSIYTKYEPSNDVREIRMEQRWRLNREKEVMEKR